MNTFIISAELFYGFTVCVRTAQFQSLDAIVEYCKMRLISAFQQENLTALVDKAKELNLHIHDHSIEEISKASSRTYYLCECVHHH